MADKIKLGRLFRGAVEIFLMDDLTFETTDDRFTGFCELLRIWFVEINYPGVWAGEPSAAILNSAAEVLGWKFEILTRERPALTVTVF